MYAVYVAERYTRDLQPGEWTYVEDEHERIPAVCLPNGVVSYIDKKWVWHDKYGSLTVIPAVWVNPGAGKPREWMGRIIDGRFYPSKGFEA